MVSRVINWIDSISIRNLMIAWFVLLLVAFIISLFSPTLMFMITGPFNVALTVLTWSWIFVKVFKMVSKKNN